ncbi:SDR family oxidoreductase [Streptomyces sp. NPDC020141]|uniref:SDR family oxidoreductase n=1 Tax=Streptomyces sp. NPDC020141 TaxID=3365065 RepID=UPI0037A11CA4
MDLELRDRVYIVTGGSRGLGHAVARELVADGAKVVVTGRDGNRVTEAAAALGPNAVGVTVDNADPRAAPRLIATARERFGGFHGLLVSVGGPPAGGVADTTDAQWRTSLDSVLLDSVLLGSVRLARAAAGELGDGGAIGFVLSLTVHEPAPAMAISNALRPGLAGFAKSLAGELGPRGIRVFGLLPGRIGTDRMRELDSLSPDPGLRRAANESEIPLRRYGTPREFGRAGAFMLSPAASYLTGVMLSVDGGARHGF